LNILSIWTFFNGNDQVSQWYKTTV
jgi:hypothetical protein